MKFLCPNCKAKYRIGPEKMVGRQAAKIRCRKCDYLIQIAYRNEGDEFDVTASPPTAPPAGAGARAAKAAAGQGAAPGSARPRSAEEGSATKKPTAAVPGLPGLGSAKSTRGAALVGEATSTGRRPLAPLPPPPIAGASAGLAGATAPAASGSPAALGAMPEVANGASGLPLPTPPRVAAANTQLGDQFRESLQAGATEDLPREGWFVGVNGVPLGPIPLGDLRELAIAGHIDRRSLVWREGQPEWRPLGKFPGLVRVIDDGASPSITPLAESAPPVPAERTNGSANGHLATGFDVVRPDLSERPSAWGDLDDDDDDDEQPTTVKGRVSVLPSGNAPVVSLIPSSAPQSLPQAAPPPAPPPPPAPAFRGNTSSVPAFGGVLPAAALPPPALSAPMPGATIGALSDVDFPASPPSRSRWYLIAAAILFAFALGAVVTHLMRSSAAEKPARGAVTSSLVSNPFEPEGMARGAELSTVEQALAPLPAVPSRSPPGEAAPLDSLQPGARPTSGSALTPPSGAALVSVGGASGQLRAGLGQSLRGTSSPGLDAEAVRRTVRRYSPAVRRSCWRRALGARSPGVPSSANVTASITVEPTGQVREVSVAGTPRGYPGLARCIEGIVRGWRFPRANARTVTSVPFMFVGR